MVIRLLTIRQNKKHSISVEFREDTKASYLRNRAKEILRKDEEKGIHGSYCQIVETLETIYGD